MIGKITKKGLLCVATKDFSQKKGLLRGYDYKAESTPSGHTFIMVQDSTSYNGNPIEDVGELFGQKAAVVTCY